MKMTKEIIDWNVIAFVEPVLHGLEKSNLMPFEYNGNRITIIGHKNNKTKLNIFFKSECNEFDNNIIFLFSYFLGRFELEGNRSYSYKLGEITNCKTGESKICTKMIVSKSIDTKYEQYLTKIDEFVKSSGNSNIVKAIEAFHYSRMATTPEHAFLSVSNAFNYLIGDIGKQNRTRCNGTVAILELYYKQILKEENKPVWGKDITWIHDTIDDIRYKNISVSEADITKVMGLFKEFVNMYIKYKQMNE